MQKLEANANILVVAGSETTATAMSGMTFYLLKNPEVHQKLKDEIRGAFNSDAEIDFHAVTTLPYLQACINETLRAYPPTPSGLPQTVPAGGETICGQFVPENVRSPLNEVSLLQHLNNARPSSPSINGPCTIAGKTSRYQTSSIPNASSTMNASRTTTRKPSKPSMSVLVRALARGEFSPQPPMMNDF